MKVAHKKFWAVEGGSDRVHSLDGKLIDAATRRMKVAREKFWAVEGGGDRVHSIDGKLIDAATRRMKVARKKFSAVDKNGGAARVSFRELGGNRARLR